MVGVVAEGMVSRRLQGEGLVQAISREVALVGGSEVDAVWGHGLLRRQVPAVVRTGAGRGLFVLLAHPDGLAAVEAALGQGAHVLLGEVALGVAVPRQHLLALGGGGREAIRLRGSVQPKRQGKRRQCEKR